MSVPYAVNSLTERDRIMNRASRRRALLAAAATACSTLVVAPLLAGGASASNAQSPGGPSTLPHEAFIAMPPMGAHGPDDITRMAVERLDHGKAVIWTAFQNGINPDGTPGKPGGPTQSTVAGFDPSSGALVETIPVTGKVDGLTADSKRDRLIATVNEDVNSAMDLVDPATRTVTTYTYKPDPAVSGNGGTDSIAIRGGHIYVAHSNPNDTTQPAEYSVRLDDETRTARLVPVFFDNSAATDATTGKPVTLGLTDPDTNFVMPEASPRFGHDLATISQADGQIVFASRLTGSPRLILLNLTDNKAGNVPPIDGLAVATTDSGTLYVVDATAGTIQAFDTSGWPAGTVFVGEPSDNNNPLIGTLDLSTGKITPLGNGFVSPKGLLFVPHNDGRDHQGRDAQDD
jgi:hypothetical protein